MNRAFRPGRPGRARSPGDTSSFEERGMSSMNRRGENHADVKVARAVASVRRAVGRLVALLGHEAPAVLDGAGLALAALGAPAVVGPLAAALPRAASPRHRALIVAALA